MKIYLEQELGKKQYAVPVAQIYSLDSDLDILCMSNEDFDNEFDAGGLGEL